VTSSPVIGPDGTIYVGSDDNYLYAFTENGTYFRFADAYRVILYFLEVC